MHAIPKYGINARVAEVSKQLSRGGGTRDFSPMVLKQLLLEQLGQHRLEFMYARKIVHLFAMPYGRYCNTFTVAAKKHDKQIFVKEAQLTAYVNAYVKHLGLMQTSLLGSFLKKNDWLHSTLCPTFLKMLSVLPIAVQTKIAYRVLEAHFYDCANYGWTLPFEQNLCIRGTPEQLHGIATTITHLQQLLRENSTPEQCVSFLNTEASFAYWAGIPMDVLAETGRSNFIENLKNNFNLTYHDIIQHYSNLGL